MAIPAATRLGPYEVPRQIGAGGMGIVYRAKDTRLRRLIAPKLLPDGFGKDGQTLERFRREAESASALKKRAARCDGRPSLAFNAQFRTSVPQPHLGAPVIVCRETVPMREGGW
jgi:serine/threonine protein kinase